MIRFINAITEKMDWDRKVYDKSIVEKWKAEVFDGPLDMSPKMFEWVCNDPAPMAHQSVPIALILTWPNHLAPTSSRDFCELFL